MRALIVTIVLLASFSQQPLFAQNSANAPLSEQQPVQSQAGPNAPAQPDAQSSDQANQRRMMERMGPGMDWDHRKPGHDLRMGSPPDSADAKR
jgi:hypothetical protein